METYEGDEVHKLQIRLSSSRIEDYSDTELTQNNAPIAAVSTDERMIRNMTLSLSMKFISVNLANTEYMINSRLWPVRCLLRCHANITLGSFR